MNALTNIKVPKEILPKPTEVERLREKHHIVARLAALGCTRGEIAQKTGFMYVSISRIFDSPAFRELITFYERQSADQFREAAYDYAAIAIGNMMTAETMISDKLNDALVTGEDLPTKELLAISRDGADRFGYGKRNTQVNVNVDFATKLEAAIKRSGVRQIEAKAVPVPVTSRGIGTDAPVQAQPTATHETLELTATPSPIRRRA